MKKMHVMVAVCMVLVVMAVAMLLPGCAGTTAEREKVFDDSIRQAETEKAAAKAAVDARIAEVKKAFDQQSAALEKEIARLEAERAGAATPQAAEKAAADLLAVKAIEAKVEKAFDAKVGKFEQVVADISKKADATIASLKSERERISSEDPGRQISGTGKVIGDALGGKEGLLVTLVSGAIGSVVTGIYQQQRLAAERRGRAEDKAVAVETVGGMTQAFKSGLVQISPEAEDSLKAAQSPAVQKLVMEAKQFYGDTIKIAVAARKLKSAKPQAAEVGAAA